MKEEYQDVNFKEVNDSNIRGKILYHSTSQVANALNITDSKLRYYSLVFTDILKIEISNKQRRYTDGDIEKLRFIIELKDTGMTIAQIQEYCSEVNFEKGIQIKDTNPLSLQAIAKALMEEQYKQMQILKDNIKDIVEGTLNSKMEDIISELSYDVEQNIHLQFQEQKEYIKVLEDKVDKINNQINFDEIEKSAIARDIEMIDKMRFLLENRENDKVSEKKKGFFGKLFR